MRIEWDTPIDVLMHGDNVAYVDLDEDEIMHWKYIKKEKRPNGKWRYYYDWKDALGYDERARYNSASIKNTFAQFELANVESDMDATPKWSLNGFLKKSKSENPLYTYEQERLSNARARAEQAGREYLSAKSEYMKTPLGKIENTKKTIKKGIKKVKRWLKKLFD